MAEWIRVVNSTIAKYIREVEHNIMRNRKLLALLRERGRISFGHSGTHLDWKVRYRRVPMTGYADMDTLTFQRENRLKTATLDWRGYSATDAVSKRERLINANTEAIVKIFSETAAMLAEDIEDQFQDELYVDGNATGNSKRIHGLESFFAATALTYTDSPVYSPNDTYAGLSTALGQYGGNWSSTGANNDWPSGTGAAEYDFWSPLIVAYDTAFWSPASNEAWSNTCKEALRYGILKGQRNRSQRGQLDLVLMENEMFRLFEEKLEGNERQVVYRNEDRGLWKLGFRDMVNFEGVDHTFEYGVPTNTAYGVCVDALELCSVQKQLFVPDGPDYDIATKTHRFSIDFLGNLRTKSPRNFVKWTKKPA